ncbi:MAG TPA: alpha/beta hydrolase [Polyangiaceae bacterium]|nr:alpha/beta hydrolase [Polyangiaceae bacterium]
MQSSSANAVMKRWVALAVPAAGVLLAFPAHAQSAACRSVKVDASLTLGLVRGEVAGTLCVPSGATTVQLLLHGFTYGQYYWDIPFEPETYSFVRAANARGFATLNIDRLGNVGSFQPLSALVTMDAQASVVHQVIDALRDGSVGTSFENVVVVGHSSGSLIAYLEAGRFQDIDALVATGASHELNAVNISTRVIGQSAPALLDPKFASLLLDPGYVTTLPGRRGTFYELEHVEPEIVALDEQLKQTSTLEEAITVLPDAILNVSRNINVPVLAVNGEREPFFCNGLLAGDCSSSAALRDSERVFYGPGAEVDAIVVPDAGHDVTLELNAPETNAAIQDWIEAQGF